MTFDQILELVNTFDNSSLGEIVYTAGDTSLTLKKSGDTHPVYTQPMVVHPQAGAHPADLDGHSPSGGPSSPAPPSPEPPSPEPQSSDLPSPEGDVEVITSPIVGTFYRAPSPDSPVFCQEGEVVPKGKTLCILEAMKVMNELEAEFTMEIVAFKVNSGDMVEYGTPIVEVRRV
ncbi:MAG: acetyl-CoA carboxylase biotin carboxyl carrier protein [Alkalispirochaeta sp.]